MTFCSLGCARQLLPRCVWIRCAAWLWPLIAIGLVGCGAGGPAIVPVSGTVMLDGKPLAGASVSFQPSGGGKSDKLGVGSAAVTDAAGKFTLKTSEEKSRPGAAVGKHVVRISGLQAQRATTDDSAKPGAQDPVPPRYRDGSLTFEVPPAGTDKADFALQSSPVPTGASGGMTGRES